MARCSAAGLGFIIVPAGFNSPPEFLTGLTSRRTGFQSAMNSGLGYFFLESQPELRENHFMGAGRQNAETGKPTKQQAGTSFTFIRSIPVYRRYRYILNNNQPIRLPGLKPGVCSGLILSGAFYPDLKSGVWCRRTYQKEENDVKK